MAIGVAFELSSNCIENELLIAVFSFMNVWSVSGVDAFIIVSSADEKKIFFSVGF